MGTITTRKLTDGTVRYRAEIRINRKNLPIHKESRTFSSKKLANAWLLKRELEIDADPTALTNKNSSRVKTLGDAIDKYLDELDGVYSSTKVSNLKKIKKFPIAKCKINDIQSTHLSDHVKLRKKGIEHLGYEPVKPSTIQGELLNIRSVLSHASIMWNLEVDLNTFDRTTAQMRKNRQIAQSDERDRLPTSGELIKLTKYFINKWNRRDLGNCYPMHLIMWFAIFSCRREAEICRLKLDDYDTYNQTWVIRDVKNPRGSKGNNKEFHVTDACKAIIDVVMKGEYKNRMLRLGYDENLLFPVNHHTIGREFRDACKMLGIDDLRFHDLRHEGCTRLVEQKFTIPEIQQVSLHESWKSLQIYVSVKKRKDVVQIEDVLHLIDEK